jgi:hypothetical protein
MIVWAFALMPSFAIASPVPAPTVTLVVLTSMVSRATVSSFRSDSAMAGPLLVVQPAG